ncbi:MAG: hypothetical protein ACI9UV_002498 [Algoriphagus sp.]|jgi:hypothetical protein
MVFLSVFFSKLNLKFLKSLKANSLNILALISNNNSKNYEKYRYLDRQKRSENYHT